MTVRILVDGKGFISEDYLIEAMTKVCVAYTDPKDIEVCEDEAKKVYAYQSLLNEVNIKAATDKFKAKYVNERFIKRTLGV